MTVPLVPDSFTTADRDNARPMMLDGVACSDAAKALTGQLALELFSRGAATKRDRPGKAYVAAVAALACDLLRNAEDDRGRWGYRSFRREAFSGQRIGYRVFKAAYDSMTAVGLIDTQAGHQQWAQGPGAAERYRSWAMASRLRATSAFFALVEAEGVAPGNWREHFDLIEPEPVVAVRDPLECRRATVRMGGERYRGFKVPIDLDNPQVRALYDRIARLNAFFAEHSISPLTHRGFRRIFQNGGGAGYRWNKGGRLYSLGEGSYQSAKKRDRAAITINGEPVVEIDIRASHLTILHALRGLPFDPSATDPYEIDGLPREIVKAWVTMTLGHDRFHARWPDEKKEEFEPVYGQPLQQAFPLRKVRETILASLPILKDWNESTIRWGDLQYIEGCAMIETVETMAFDHNVPCLPVHDSVIVPVAQKEKAEDVLSQSFYHHVGVYPHLKEA